TNVSGEPAKRIVQVLGTSGRPPVHPHVDLRAMQLCHHFCREYPMPEHCSVVELQQRVARHLIDACIDATTRAKGSKYWRRLQGTGTWPKTPSWRYGWARSGA